MHVFKSSDAFKLRLHRKETHTVKVFVGRSPFGIISQFLLTGAR
jgi:hypothetical protein